MPGREVIVFEWYNRGVKTDLNTNGTLPQARPAVAQKGDSKLMPGALGPDGKLLAKSSPDYVLELSSKNPQAGAGTGLPSLPSMPSISSVPTPSLSLPDLPTSAAKDVPTKDIVKEAAKDKVKEEVKAEKIKEPVVKDGTLKKPAIFFVKGLDIFSSPSKSEGGYAGLGRIAESVEGSRLYGWDQKDEMIKEIRKVHPDYPVILVGHSLGGDTAIEIADELDSLKEKFRPVDLLVTIDAIGFNHDIIPQNVKEHLNVFGETSFFLKDGPHVARREEKTNVRNILSPLDHTEIDDDKEVQFEIVNMIQKTLKDMKA